MKFGIIGPSEDEIIPFIEGMSNKEMKKLAMLTFHSGKYENVEVVAGAIDKVLKIGDTVISTEIAYHDVDEGILTEYHPWMESVYFKTDSKLLELSRAVIENNQFTQNVYFGKIVTGEAFISESGRTEIISKYNPLCVDMETASIAHVCYANTIPFIAVRSITDTEEASGIEVFEDNCVSASHHSIHFVKKLLESL
ncbi:5'-methylthioadenosine/S-adenosylhomocysteine nucleosidase [Bacillus toyonensis]|uniref:adenosylhomocysteine nucleosidase n=1 Tax=Bacillus toyonensis TaxID=155322 RepID=A0A2B5XYV4_9BACI|nr:5'-methylthioadenosine/S-adenosylhomocysteine nucleosidase [Bacillus toyonensis]PGB01575.1 5'-methylthioadenosine/S-adenosylhomocysteine nucleosidase [Bacillus toyonensis]PHD60619.1 5'-methylthioadenosine/S-adenosylhomocysteine nucleosidase [Bacillus toyonensis]